MNINSYFMLSSLLMTSYFDWNVGKATISDVVKNALSRIDNLLSVTSMLPKTEPMPPRYTIDFNDDGQTNTFLYTKHHQKATGPETSTATSLVWHPR